MSTLADRLERIKEGFRKQAPAEAAAIMHRATNDLRDSGIMDRIPRVGDSLPHFQLEDTAGQSVSSQQLLDRGPLVITVYRGVW